MINDNDENEKKYFTGKTIKIYDNVAVVFNHIASCTS